MILILYWLIPLDYLQISMQDDVNPNQGWSIILSQIKAIVLNNLIINFRARLFLKELGLTSFIIWSASFQIETQKQWADIYNPKIVLFSYNIIAMVFIAQASVMVHMDNRKKFIYFQKAYGLNSIVYTLTWILYSLLIGALKFSFYILIVYIYLVSDNQFFKNYFKGYGGYYFKNQWFYISYGSVCLINFLTFLSVYSYSLFMAIIFGHNQIGLKLLSSIIIIGMTFLTQLNFMGFMNLDRFIYFTPIGCLSSISYFGQLGPQKFYESGRYIEIMMYQFVVPLVSSFVIEIIRLNRFEIKKSAIKRMKKLKSGISTGLKRRLINYQSSNESSNQDILIKIMGLNKKQKQKVILNDVNLEIRRGEIITMFGKNGSGKTTILNILTNNEHISSGSITYFKRIMFGISMEQNYFEDQLTVKENLFFYAKLKGVAINSQSNYYLERFELIDFCNKEYYKISGGNRKKLSIACAFLGENDVIILDEPTMGIDFAVKKEIENIILREKEENKHLAIIISTCSLEFNFTDFIDKIWLIDQGKIIYNQSIENLAGEKDYIIGSLPFNFEDPRISDFQQEVSKDPSIKIIREESKFRLLFDEKHLENISRMLKRYQLQNSFQFSLSSIKNKIQQKMNNLLNSSNQQEQLINFKQQLTYLNQKQSFVALTLSSLILRYYEIAPNIIDLLYYALVPLVCWSYIYWLVQGTNEESVLTGLFQTSYPNMVNFMYSHIAVTHLQFKESYYETIMFKMGMKKIPYWIASYLINIILIVVPFIIVALFFQPESSWVDKRIMDIALYSIVYIAISYFFSIFFTSSYVCFIFLPTIFTVANKLFLSSRQYLEFIKSPYHNLAKIITNIFIPNCAYNNSQSMSQRCLTQLGQLFFYVTLYFVVNEIIYRIKNSRKGMDSSEMLENTYEEAIDQKLKVFDIIQNKKENKDISLILSDVYMKYSKRITGIKGLNLVVKKGSVLALLGMNGSGKSTTLKLIMNEFFKTIGNIYFNYREIKSQTSYIYQKISISPQINYLINDISVILHLNIICTLKGIRLSLQNKIIASFLTLFKMWECRNLKIRYLSGGSKRKLKFMSALLGKSKFLLLDEPTLGVDLESEKMFEQILKFLTQQLGSTCIYITHRLDEVQRHCEKIAILKRGGLVLSDLACTLVEKYSRGVQIHFHSHCLKELSSRVRAMLNQRRRVYQATSSIQHKELKILIPYEQFDFKECIELIAQLKEQGLVHEYGLKRQGISQIFEYLVNKTQTVLKLMASNQRNKII